MSQEHRSRLEALRLGLDKDVDGLLVSTPSNVFYLTGFRGSAGLALITRERALLLSDFRYRLQAAQQAPDYEFVEVARGLLKGAGECLLTLGLRSVGYESTHLTCQGLLQLGQAAPEVELTPMEGAVERLRLVKSPAEVARMRAAARLTDAAVAHLVSLLRPGARERDLALEAEFLMRRSGAEAVAFEVIVASGPNGALPHAEPTERALQPGDLVVVDIGARVQGYCSDMTRTFAVEEASTLAQEVYALVYRAQRAALSQVRAGAGCGALDAVARDLLTEAGYGENFGHSLGHGVGIDIHEAPRLAREVETQLTAGNVVTVEPGIYLSDRFGIRLEDMVLVTEEGAETLTGYPLSPELPILAHP